MEETKTRKPGRPVGYELSDLSKEKIRQSRIGKSHSLETRNKISTSLLRYFKKRDPVSIGIEYEYRSFPIEAREWLEDHRAEMDITSNIMTNKRIEYLSQHEISYGSEIENFCHRATPEFFLMLKEELGDSAELLSELMSLV